MTKYQVAYRGWRTPEEIVEVHHARCRDIEWNGQRKGGALLEAANAYGAAVAAWSHKKTGDDSLVFARTEFFPCLAQGKAQKTVQVPSFGLRDSLEAKVEGTAAWAEEHDWDVKDLGQSLELTRDDEFLVCAWDGNRWDGSLSNWTFDGRSIRMASHSDALRRIAGHPEDVPGAEERKKPVRQPTMRNVPFDIDGAYDHEIVEAVAGRRLVWLNSMTGEEESANVPPSGRQTRVHVSSTGRRILTFCDYAGNASTGYRSVALDALVAVK